MNQIKDYLNYIFIAILLLFQLQFFLLNLYIKIRTKSKVRGKSIEATVFIVCILALYLIVIWDVFLPNDHFLFTHMIPESYALMYFELFFLLLGFSLGIFSSINLGKSWRVGVSADMKTELVQSGIYKFIRNPYFLSYCLILLSLILAFSNILIIIFSFIAFIFIHKMILAEEAHLINIHGAAYVDFKNRTWRYFPPF